MRCATLLCFLLLFSATLLAPSRDVPGVDVADLKDQLKNGLVKGAAVLVPGSALTT
ncbi:MAG: hypothetical protein QGH11_12500 [Pirellulaceae bacterium]|nr:hypothetical protein [Pirellulaceae bacterium]